MIHHWVTRVLLLVAGFMQIHADPTISTFTPTPCYGDVVTLVCHHPEVASNPGRYFSTQPTWRENGIGITPSDGTMFKANTAVEPTHTNLTIIITVDHFRNKSFSYSCLLVLAKNGQPNGSETSENVTVDPVEPQPPSDIHNNTFLNTSIIFNWIHTPGECYKGRISYVSWVNINNNTESGSDVTGGHMYSMTGLAVNVNYTVSVRAVVDRNFQSTAVSRNVTTGSPNAPHNISSTPGVDSINVSWEHDDSCFKDRWFIVTWKDPRDRGMSHDVTKTTFNITGLNPGTNYSICISAVSTLDKQAKSKESCLYQKTNASPLNYPCWTCWWCVTVVTVIACML